MATIVTRLCPMFVLAMAGLAAGHMALAETDAPPLPAGFVYLADIAPGIRQDIRYAGARNFTAAPVPGYQASECVLLQEAAEALARVDAGLRSEGYALLVYDCYRPARAVSAFVRWSAGAGPGDESYYPHTDRRQLVAKGYIASRSGHSTGATIDLTLVQVGASQDLEEANPKGDCTAPVEQRAGDGSVDMGTAFDCFDRKSWTGAGSLSGEQREMRQRLVAAMAKQGFANYAKEWWHFSFTEPRQKLRYLDFVVPPRPSPR